MLFDLIAVGPRGRIILTPAARTSSSLAVLGVRTFLRVEDG
jgi:hypothetical protein